MKISADVAAGQPFQIERLSSFGGMTAGYWTAEGLRYYSPALHMPDGAWGLSPERKNNEEEAQYGRISGQGTHHRGSDIQSLAGPARRVVHSSLHRHGLRSLRVLVADDQLARRPQWSRMSGRDELPEHLVHHDPRLGQPDPRTVNHAAP